MELLEAVKQRHSVRAYTDEPLSAEIKAQLQAEVDKCNALGNYHIQLVTDEPNAFTGFLAHYGKFENVKNYIALVGNSSDDLDEKLGFLGERLVIYAQTLGLNTCWVYLTYNKKKANISVLEGEEVVCVIALGYGKTSGISHKNKPVSKLSDLSEGDPDWYKNGVECALCAPTAINEQKFFIKRSGNEVSITATGGGRLGNIDLGIVKYDFSVGAGDNFVWAK